MSSAVWWLRLGEDRCWMNKWWWCCQGGEAAEAPGGLRKHSTSPLGAANDNHRLLILMRGSCCCLREALCSSKLWMSTFRKGWCGVLGPRQERRPLVTCTITGNQHIHPYSQCVVDIDISAPVQTCWGKHNVAAHASFSAAADTNTKNSSSMISFNLWKKP